MKYQTKRHIGYGLLSLFIAYTAFLVLFFHVDIVDGRLVAHAHVHEIWTQDAGSSSGTHHSIDQLVFLQQLSSITTFGSTIFIAYNFKCYDHLIMLVELRNQLIPKTIQSSFFALRAPPAVF